jgi:hypothetical protein
LTVEALEERTLPALGFGWAFGAGATGNGALPYPYANDSGYNLALDSASNLYVTGRFHGTVDFDPGPGSTTLTSTPEAGGAFSGDAFVARYDAAGNFVWARSMGGAGDDAGFRITTGSDGTVYVAGFFSGTATFGTTTLTGPGATDAFVARLDANGNFLWAASLGGGYGNGVAVDGAGNAYVTGSLNPSGGPTDMFVTKLDAGGNLSWSKQIGGSSGAYGSAVAVDSAGSVYLTGNFAGTVDFDPGPGTFSLNSGSGGAAAFVLKLGPAGDFVWAQAFQSSGHFGYSNGLDIALDAAGNVYTTGSFSGKVDFDPGSGKLFLSSIGGYSSDVFVTKLNVSGNLVWARTAGSTDADHGNALGLDGSGNVYVIGDFGSAGSPINFNTGSGTYTLSNAGRMDVFVWELNTNGNFVAAAGMGGPGNDSGTGIGVDGSGNVYTTGWFTGTADFDPSPGGVYDLTSGGGQDIFVAKLIPTSPLRAAAGIPAAAAAGALAPQQVWPIIDEALARWAAPGADLYKFDSSVTVVRTSLTGVANNGDGTITLIASSIGGVTGNGGTVSDPMADLLAQVANLNLSSGVINSLTSKLQPAEQSFTDGNTTPAENQLGAFINQVDALVNSNRPSKLTADDLTGAVDDLIQLLG